MNQPRADKSETMRRAGKAEAEEPSAEQLAHPDDSAAAASPSNACTSSAPTSALPGTSRVFAGPRLSFLGMAVVERQLIMQGLDIASLARLASTCKQLSAEALHREAGKFIPAPIPDSALDRQCWIDRDHPAHASSLFRMHVPVRVDFHYVDTRMTLDQQQALMANLARFSRITELNTGSWLWTEAQALQLLAQPWMQSVNTVGMCSPVWLRSSAVQHAMFALPQLASICLDLASDEGCELHQSALSLASKLSEAHISLPAGGAKMLRALRTASSLRTLELLSQDDAPLGPCLWIMPPALTELRLSEFLLEPESMMRSALKTMFTRLPRLRRLCTTRMDIAPLLQGVLDAGVNALPDLRLVEFANGVIAGLTDRVIRRFLHKFPAATVRFDYLHVVDRWESEDAKTIGCRYGAWPRVQVVSRFTTPLSPHASDADSESEVELEPEPAEDA